MEESDLHFGWSEKPKLGLGGTLKIAIPASLGSLGDLGSSQGFEQRFELTLHVAQTGLD